MYIILKQNLMLLMMHDLKYFAQNQLSYLIYHDQLLFPLTVCIG